jgi:hypothetical protein
MLPEPCPGLTRRGETLPLGRLLTDAATPMRLRVAGVIVLPYAQPLTRIVRLNVDDVLPDDGAVGCWEDGLPVRTEQGNIEVVPETSTFICDLHASRRGTRAGQAGTSASRVSHPGPHVRNTGRSPLSATLRRVHPVRHDGSIENPR